MSFNWQDTTALMVVASAAVYLLRVARTALAGKKGTACGACPKCASDRAPLDNSLVVLDIHALGSKPEGR